MQVKCEPLEAPADVEDPVAPPLEHLHAVVEPLDTPARLTILKVVVVVGLPAQEGQRYRWGRLSTQMRPVPWLTPVRREDAHIGHVQRHLHAGVPRDSPREPVPRSSPTDAPSLHDILWSTTGIPGEPKYSSHRLHGRSSEVNIMSYSLLTSCRQSYGT